MSELLAHGFVWLVSPAVVIATAVYALHKKQFFLGAFATAGVWAVCFVIAAVLFDGHLLVYGLLYAIQLVIPALLLVVALMSAGRKMTRFIARRRGTSRVS